MCKCFFFFRLDDMHASLPDLKYRSPPLWCSIVIGCLCLHSKAFFVLPMHWLIHVLAIHSAVNAVPIPGCLRQLLLALFIKLDPAPSVVLLDSSWRIFSHGFVWELSSDWLCASCQYPSRLLISHELAYTWNSTLQVHVIISLLGNHPVI